MLPLLTVYLKVVLDHEKLTVEHGSLTLHSAILFSSEYYIK
jgi:hypothetical protein